VFFLKKTYDELRQIKRNKLLELKKVDLAFSLYDESPKLIWDEPLKWVRHFNWPRD